MKNISAIPYHTVVPDGTFIEAGSYPLPQG
jgi:hypothetical protein